MNTISLLLDSLDEREIAQEVGINHDNARIAYPLQSNTVNSFHEFSTIIGDYVNHHFTACISNGGAFSKDESTSRAKEILEKEYRRQNGDIVTAYNDAHDGTNGGLRAVLDIIAEGLKAESVERYTREKFDQYVSPADYDEQVEIIREFLQHYGHILGSSIQTNNPQRYARNYKELIISYVEGLKHTSRVFRRL